MTAIVAITVGGFLRRRLGLFGCAVGATLLARAAGGVVVWAMTGEETVGMFFGIVSFFLAMAGFSETSSGGSSFRSRRFGGSSSNSFGGGGSFSGGGASSD